MITLTREEAQQVLDALLWRAHANHAHNPDFINDAIASLRARLSAPEPKRVDDKEMIRRVRALLPEVAVKAIEEPIGKKKEWQGLTDEEMEAVANSVEYNPLAMTVYEYRVAVQKATSAKLREKNT